MRKFQLEMGGKNPMVVLDDADLEVAVDACLNGAFYSTGQRCTASSRLIVQDGIHDRFVERLKERMAALVVGDPLDKATQIGPVVDAGQLEQDESYIAIGKDEGAELVGGERLKRDTEGFFLAPALFVGATNAMRISREEIFGPVAGVIRVKDYDEALERRQRHRVRAVGRHLHHLAQARDPLQAQRRGRDGDGQRADRRRRLPRAVRRLQGLELRPARAGPLRRRVLHHRQDRIHRGLRVRGVDWRSLALGLTFAAIWSSAFTSSRIVVEYWPPFLVLSVRFLFSGLLALGIGFAAGQRIELTRAEWRAVVVFGVCQNALYLGLFHYAMQTVEAGLAAIIASALPLCVAGARTGVLRPAPAAGGGRAGFSSASPASSSS